MNINFHYFAVKTLAIRAGFSAKESQIIASYSQFVDDYNRFGKVNFDCVPEFARHLAKKDHNTWSFTCITTGFSSLTDYARLIRKENQCAITIPFHFIPPYPLSSKLNEDSPEWRVKPETLQEPTLLRSLLFKAKAGYQKSPDARENLINLGLLLHIFADTYSHQKFSGFGGWWNYGQVISSESNTEKVSYHNIEDKEQGNRDMAIMDFTSPVIGHALFGTTPDETWLRFTARQLRKKNILTQWEAYSRDNTKEFLLCARRLLDFLRDCRGLHAISDAQWRATENGVRKGFLTKEKNVNKLADHWHRQFPDIEYGYHIDTLLNQSLGFVDNQIDAASANTMTMNCTASGDGGESGRLAVIFSNSHDESEQPDAIASTGVDLQMIANDGASVQVLSEKVLTAKNNDFFWYNVFAQNIRDAVRNGIKS